MTAAARPPTDDRDLTLTRLIAATPDVVFRAWTEPDLLRRWFAPLPWTTPAAEMDVRPGGASLIVMRGPDGVEMPNRGVYLEVIQDRRLVFTDAFTDAWTPAAKPFMTVIVDLTEEAGQTRYDVLVRHWTAADRETHEAMGFHQGWGQCTDQLEALVAGL